MISKSTVVKVLVTLWLASLGLFGYGVYRVMDLAQQGAEVHAAECLHVAELQSQVDKSRALLALTPAQRKARLGFNVSENLLRQSIAEEMAAVRSYHILHCGGG